MAEMGAEIIKVELAPNGDLSRTFPYIKDGRSAYFVQQNRGKLSLCVDIKHPAGKAVTLLHLDKDGDRGQSLVSLRELMSISESWIDVSYFPTP